MRSYEELKMLVAEKSVTSGQTVRVMSRIKQEVEGLRNG
jgi:hypothetical protein